MIIKAIKSVLSLLFRVDVIGNYESDHEKTLIIANHSSFLDGILLGLFLPTQPVFVVHTSVEKNHLFKFFLNYVDYLSVDPSHPMAMKKVINLLDSGRPVVIFPEGRITITGSLMKIYSGAAFAATRSQATIIPVQITGAKHSYFSRLQGLFNRRLFPKLTINIFPSTQINMDESLPVRERRDDAKDKMHQLMMEMQVASRQTINLYQKLLEGKKIHGSHHLLFEDGLSEDLNYKTLIKKSASLGILLHPKLKTKRVALMLPNSNAGIITFYALQYLGKVPAMLNYTAGELAIRAAMTSTEADTIITSRRFIEKADLLNLLTNLAEYKVIYLEDILSKATFTDKCQVLLKRNFINISMAKPTPSEEAVVLFTSGSEGLPKGVVHSHESMLTNVAQIQAIYDMMPSDKFMICLPTFHVFGLTGGILLPISTGCAAFMYPNPLHYRAIPEIIYDRGCTVLLGTSTFLAGYARFADQYDFYRLRYIISGAEKLSPEVSKTYSEKFGIRVMEGYGATETAPVIAANNQMASQVGSVGRLLPGITAKLEPVEGINEGGKLIVTADNVMLGYLKADNPGVIEPAKNIAGKRQYDTGDIVEIDNKGYLFIKGRAKRFAKIAGEMVSLESAEKIAITSSTEAQHAVISRVDAKKGEALVLYTTDSELDKKQLSVMAKSLGYPELAVPKDIRIIEAIPVFSSGKTNYPALKVLLETE